MGRNFIDYPGFQKKSKVRSNLCIFIVIPHNLGHSTVCLKETHILKQSVMFQTCLLPAKKQRLKLAYRHCERDKKILHPHAISGLFLRWQEMFPLCQLSAATMS